MVHYMINSISDTESSGAAISECDCYRYFLSRRWCKYLPSVTFIMLNPSTADYTNDDATIRRIKRFARDNDYGGINVLNLYALRVTDSTILFDLIDPIGAENDGWIKEFLFTSDDVICAWGTKAKPDRVEWLKSQVFGTGKKLYCLGTNKDGSPKHPLYLRKDVKMVEWYG